MRSSIIDALRTALSDLSERSTALMATAIDHLDERLRTHPVTDVGTAAVVVAVFRALSDQPVPMGLLATSAATYLAFDLLDDLMDGDRPAYMGERHPGEQLIASQILLVTASQVVAEGSPPVVAAELGRLNRRMLVETAEGQLHSDQPLDETTTPAHVAAAIDRRSGSMLGAFAAMAAVAAGAGSREVDAARQFGHHLGVARQHINDLTELLGERTSDLRNQTATMAAAFALQEMQVTQRRQLLDDMQHAAADPEVRGALLTSMARAIGETALLALLHLNEARLSARLLLPSEIRQDGITALIEHTTATLRRTVVH
jgi:geranylgeranyl pyrophosphate synthase